MATVVDTGSFHSGMKIRWQDDIWEIVDCQHHKMGRGGAIVRTKLKNLESGSIIENSFRSGERFERVVFEEKPAQFLYQEGENYVFFEDVPLGNPNMIRLYYTGQLNGIQLVSRKTPFAVIASTDPNDNLIDARNYDVAFETNARGGESTIYGPDLGNYVHYLDTGEYMEYDIVVDAAEQGRYYLSADFVTYWGAAGLRMYINGILLGTLTQTQHNEDPAVYRSLEDLPINLFTGTHTLRWENTQNYFDVVQLRLTYEKEITLETCEDVYLYGLEPAGDLNEDCRVNILDLEIIVENWLVNYDPEAL